MDAHYNHLMTVPPPACIGDPLCAVDTPALIVDLDALEANIARMAAFSKDAGVALRPHAKSHKCAPIALAQIAAGAVGVCCQKVSEAAAMIAGGIADVFVSNEIVGAAKTARLAELARVARVSVCVDDAANAADLDHSARRAGVMLEVFVEVDVGAHRCGVAPGGPAVRLAQAVNACGNLHLAGLHAYHGGAQHLRSVVERRAAIERAAALAAATRAAIQASGIDCSIVTGAGTGTFAFEVASRVYTEVQPGSYVFMDADYQRNCWEGMPRFAQSLLVWTTVMSTPASNRVVVDAGLKAHAVDSGMPLVHHRPELEYRQASDEHGVISVAAGATPPSLGDQLALVPGHCDPTVNLHDWLLGVRGGVVETVWPVTARGAVY